ncbi:MAG: hypothetical protein JWP76_2404 [Dactylosporangium sp.]|jgi:hypothetical protein|nr:hypothetical protein [Dactylosporangium sp.]
MPGTMTVGSVRGMDGDTMVGFGPKQAWLAVREGEETAVCAALGLRDLGTASWRSGIDLAYLTDDRLVLTPPLPGVSDARWLLVTGRWLLRAALAVDVAELSATLGTEVQFFATYRVSELHRWQRAVDGVLLRAFEFVGETGEVTEWRGEPDEAEAAIGLPAVLDDEADILVSEDDVMRLARAWSVDPTALNGRPAPGPLRAAAVP